MITPKGIRDIKSFYDFLSKDVKGTLFSCNTKLKTELFRGFSPNNFVDSAEKLVQFAQLNQQNDCYSIINPLKEKTNRKFDNLSELTTLGLDIEFLAKKSPETDERLQVLLDIVKRHIIKAFDITNYMLTCSGNGYHLYINLGNSIPINSNIKAGYKETVKWINAEANLSLANEQGLDNEIQTTDRKDINGILRIPETTNTKCGRIVKLIELKNEGKNKSIRRAIFRHTNQHIKFMKNNTKKFVINSNSALLPTSFEELESHPLVVALLDTDLPEVTGWYSTVGFAVQSIIKASGLPYNGQMQLLESEINNTWGTMLSLQSCSTDDYMIPVLGALNFLRQNKFEKYVIELQKLLNLDEDSNGNA